MELKSERFLLRELISGDVTKTYLGWFDDSISQKWISSAHPPQKINDLVKYVAERINRKDVLFIGIFDIEKNIHIGNIKYEPVNYNLGYAVMGIFIGEKDYRGKGVFSEVFKATSLWLKENLGITEIILGVDKNNSAAIHAYKKSGFKETKSPYIKNSGNGITMSVVL